MRALPAYALSFAIVGCGNITNTGDALIATGAVVAVVASEVATRNTCSPQIPDYTPSQTPCVGGTSNKTAETAAGIGVLAGVTLAAAGQAMKEEDFGDSQRPPATHPTATFQLGSEPETTEQTEAEEASEGEPEPAVE